MRVEALFAADCSVRYLGVGDTPDSSAHGQQVLADEGTAVALLAYVLPQAVLRILLRRAGLQHLQSILTLRPNNKDPHAATRHPGKEHFRF